MWVTSYSSFQALPDSHSALFEWAAGDSFCLTRWWFECLAGTITPSDRLCLIAVERDATGGHPLALLPCYLDGSNPNSGRGKSLRSLSNCYSMVFAPLVAAGADPAPVLRILAEAIRDTRPKYDVLRFQPLDRASPLFGALQSGLRDAGLIVQPYFHCGNWYERTAGMGSADYLARRPTALRNTDRKSVV